MPRHYALRCVACQRLAPIGDRLPLVCDGDHAPSLLRAEYQSTRFTVDEAAAGIFRYRTWLPVERCLEGAGRARVFHSTGLGAALGLEQLDIAFSGYWPERGARLETCSFKELEALTVAARRRPDGRTLVVASAGNTGRAFLQIGSKHSLRVVVVVPQSALPSMWLTVPRGPQVTLVAVAGDADYRDAIEVAGQIAALEGYEPEGGAKNIGRRDGMGTVVLAGTEARGALPEHYVQAVGSGTGGVAAWEMAQRLQSDGSFADQPMQLHLFQNQPFTIMSDAWQQRSRQLPELDERRARAQISSLFAPVLSNRAPAWGLHGGLFDALRASGGSMGSVSRQQALEAAALFARREGIDILPAAAVAVAGLVQAVRDGRIGRRQRVLLNITGGGVQRLASERRHQHVQPDLILPRRTPTGAALRKALQRCRGLAHPAAV